MKYTNKKQILRTLYLALFLTFNWSSYAQTTATDLLDAANHPKFNIGLPGPAVIDATGGGSFNMEMAQTTQWLGLYAEGTPQPPPINATKLNTTVWGYGPERGTITYPGPTFEAMENVAIDIRWANNLPNQHLLPVDQTLHWAAPPKYPKNGQPAVVHLHGGHTEAASDGLPEAWFTRRWRDRGPTWVKKVSHYDNDQEAATLWYHDHALGITRLNVYAGLDISYPKPEEGDFTKFYVNASGDFFHIERFSDAPPEQVGRPNIFLLFDYTRFPNHFNLLDPDNARADLVILQHRQTPGLRYRVFLPTDKQELLFSPLDSLELQNRFPGLNTKFSPATLNNYAWDERIAERFQKTDDYRQLLELHLSEPPLWRARLGYEADKSR